MRETENKFMKTKYPDKTHYTFKDNFQDFRKQIGLEDYLKDMWRFEFFEEEKKTESW